MIYSFSHRWYFEKTYTTIPRILSIFAFITSILLIKSLVIHGLFNVESITLAFTTLIIIVEVVFMRFVFENYIRVLIVLKENCFIYNDVLQIEYKDILKIKFPSFSLLGIGRSIKIFTPNINIVLSSTLYNFNIFVIEFKKRLDENNLSDKYDSNQYYKFYKTATNSEHRWIRMEKAKSTLYTTSIISFILALSTLFIIQPSIYKYGYFILFYLNFNIFLPMIGFLITEVIFYLKLTKSFELNTYKDIKNDTKYESKVYKIAIFICTILILTSLIAFVYYMKLGH